MRRLCRAALLAVFLCILAFPAAVAAQQPERARLVPVDIGPPRKEAETVTNWSPWLQPIQLPKVSPTAIKD